MSQSLASQVIYSLKNEVTSSLLGFLLMAKEASSEPTLFL